jgi:DNA polymerase III sliding clamp (beta) subunit (PCNA family)
MISSITFETAALADVIKKAARIAPSKGSAFDKAAGIVIEFNPASPIPLAVVRTTNLDIFSIEWVNVSQWSGEPAQWRLPSSLVAQVIGSLPIGTGKTVTLESEATGHSYVIHLKSDRTKAKFYPIDASYYPTWGAFDPDNMYPANDLGGRIDQVEWAAGRTDPALAGVYLDGEVAIATDTYRLACVPLPIPDLTGPIIIPAGILGQVLKQTGEIKIGVSDNMFHIMPDDHTQIKAVIYDVKYPNVSKVISMEFDTEVKISRDAMIEVMNRTNAFSVGDRGASFRIFLGAEEFAVFMQNEQVGQIGDVIETPGYAVHDRFEQRFNPKFLTEAVSKSPNDSITLKYNAGNPRSILHIDGGSGYRAWVVPRSGEQE